MTHAEWIDPELAASKCTPAEQEIVRLRNLSPPMRWTTITQISGKSRGEAKRLHANAKRKVTVPRSRIDIREPQPSGRKHRTTPLLEDHPDYIDHGTAGRLCTKRERDVVYRRNNGMDWPEIAVETGFTKTMVRQLHGGALAKVTRDFIPRRAAEQSKPGYVYFLRSEDHIKIGYAVDVAARIKELQCGNPVRLQLLGVIPAEPADERVLHQRFASIREQGEWFRRTRALHDFIQSEKLAA